MFQGFNALPPASPSREDQTAVLRVCSFACYLIAFAHHLHGSPQVGASLSVVWLEPQGIFKLDNGFIQLSLLRQGRS